MFDGAVRRELGERAQLEAALGRAIAEDELMLHYQPIVDLARGTVSGYEALVRWERPGHGLVPPCAFVPVAELTSLICELECWVSLPGHRPTRHLGQSRRRRQHRSVNISGRHVPMPRIVDDVRAALHEAGLPADRLVLEITETVLTEDLRAIDHQHWLRELGVAISIDVFGTGYNSVTRFKDIPIDVLKI